MNRRQHSVAQQDLIPATISHTGIGLIQSAPKSMLNVLKRWCLLL
jgi:hypothetical protein